MARRLLAPRLDAGMGATGEAEPASGERVSLPHPDLVQTRGAAEIRDTLACRFRGVLCAYPPTNRRPPRRLGQLRPQRHPVAGRGFNVWIWGRGVHRHSAHTPPRVPTLRCRAGDRQGQAFPGVPCVPDRKSHAWLPRALFLQKEHFAFAQKPKAAGHASGRAAGRTVRMRLRLRSLSLGEPATRCGERWRRPPGARGAAPSPR